jgi:hypothetical protein
MERIVLGGGVVLGRAALLLPKIQADALGQLNGYLQPLQTKTGNESETTWELKQTPYRNRIYDGLQHELRPTILPERIMNQIRESQWVMDRVKLHQREPENPIQKRRYT